GGGFHPGGAASGGGPWTAPGEPVPAGRGGRHVLRAARSADGGTLARAHPAGLHVRRQGPRPPDGTAARDEAPAEEHPGGPAPGSRGQGSPVRPRPPARCRRGDLSTLSRGTGAIARSRTARRRPPAVPALGVPIVRESGGDPGGERAAGRP